MLSTVRLSFIETTKVKFMIQKKMRKKASEIQIGGDHYKKLKISPLDFILANNLSYCLGQVVKYICRDKDNKIEDLLKAKHYIDLELEKVHKVDKKGKKLVD